jgi:hypothetical protein
MLKTGQAAILFSLCLSGPSLAAWNSFQAYAPSLPVATPILYHGITTSTNPIDTNGTDQPGHTYIINTEALPANTEAVMAVTAPQSVPTVSISSILAGSWAPAVCSASGGSGQLKAWLFIEPLGATGGQDTITINVGGTAVQPVQATLSFFENAGVADGTLCSSSPITPTSGGVISPGSFTPTTNNNAAGGHIIWGYAAQSTLQGKLVNTGWSPASGFALINGDIAWTTSNTEGFTDAAQWQTQTLNGSVTPSFTSAGETATGDTFNFVGVALKVVNNGATAPTGIHVANILHESSAGYSGTNITWNLVVPTVGNLRVLSTTCPGGTCWGSGATLTGVNSGDGCLWTRETANGGADLWYAQNCSPAPAGTLSLNFTGGTLGIGQVSVRIFDVINAQASSFQSYVANSAGCNTSSVVNAPTITPTISSGLTIAAIGASYFPITGFYTGFPSTATFDLWTFTPASENDFSDNADGVGHLYFTSNATQNWNWAHTVGSDVCDWSAAIFK